MREHTLLFMINHTFTTDESAMLRALEISQAGIGLVEPNPTVGAVITDANGRFISEGFHSQYGGPHAEVVALNNANESVTGATIYVTLEPCSHQGKTPPCADALIAAGVGRVVVAAEDPAPHVAGEGIKRLRNAGIQVDVGTCSEQAQALIAPFRKLQLQKQPFVHAKWAMTLDGKIASRNGSSKWISNEKSRAVVHQIRGRMDGIITGIGTVLSDDPLLTVRPPGLRVPTRIVLDSQARLPLTSNLIQSLEQSPILLFVSQNAADEKVAALVNSGIEVIKTPLDQQTDRLDLSEILNELGRRQMTNVLLEAGGQVLGAFWDGQHIDEVHCFVAPKLIGGSGAHSPLSGLGLESMEQAPQLENPRIETLDENVYINGRVEHSSQK